MNDWISLQLLGTLLPAILGPLAYVLSGWILNLFRAIDDLPPATKRVVVFAIAFTLAAAVQAIGLTLPGECEDLWRGAIPPSCQAALSAPVFLKAMLGAFGAYLLHALKKSDPRGRVRTA